MQKKGGTSASRASQLHEQIFPSQDIGFYKVKKIVGKGAYGFVAKAVHKHIPGYFAVKKIGVINSIPEVKRILREIILLKKCQHPNIVNLIDIMIPKNQTLDNFNQLYLVTEYCEADLQKLFKEDVYLELDHIRKITYQILCGLKYLHHCNILHRDLKPANILINNETQSVKICDFGLSRSIDDKLQQEKQIKKQEKSEQSSEGSCDQAQLKQIISSQLPKMTPKILPKKNGLLKRPVQLNKQTQQIKEQQPSQVQPQPQKNLSAKSLTARVITRWYRAPEVILVVKNYGKPVDVWSFGCIFGQILKMLKSCCLDWLQRFPLFPGKYCYPLSPPNQATSNMKSQFPHGRNDQLLMILTALGKPSQEDINYLQEAWAKNYVKNLQVPKRKSFSQIFPKMSEQVIQVLQKALKFNPNHRSSAQELLQLKFFESVRKESLEFGYEQFPQIDQKIQDLNITLQQLRGYIKQQILGFWQNIKNKS